MQKNRKLRKIVASPVNIHVVILIKGPLSSTAMMAFGCGWASHSTATIGNAKIEMVGAIFRGASVYVLVPRRL